MRVSERVTEQKQCSQSETRGKKTAFMDVQGLQRLCKIAENSTILNKAVHALFMLRSDRSTLLNTP